MQHTAYAEGKFQNIEFIDSAGDKSVGVIAPGSYTFTTEREETVTCTSGVITIDGVALTPGESKTTPAGQSFTISTEETSSYMCSYK